MHHKHAHYDDGDDDDNDDDSSSIKWPAQPPTVKIMSLLWAGQQ